MRKGRLYLHLRGAYSPRLWPILVVAIPLNLTIGWLVRPVSPLAALALALGVGVGVPTIRLVVFSRRHPKITPEQYLQDRRDKATWN